MKTTIKSNIWVMIYFVAMFALVFILNSIGL